jgi:hypothetical protein
MKENFFITIESLHLPDRGTQNNVHELNSDKLKQREVVTIDIASDSIASTDYKQTEDPSKFKSEKSGRGPLVGAWKEAVNKFTYYIILKYNIVSLITKGDHRLRVKLKTNDFLMLFLF